MTAAFSIKFVRKCRLTRGELEITDVNNAYIREGTLSFEYLDGWWIDAGSFDTLQRAGQMVLDRGAAGVRKVAP